MGHARDARHLQQRLRADAQGAAVQCLPVPFAKIAEETMVPVSHILWAAVWIGVAGDAFHRAHQFFRAQPARPTAHRRPRRGASPNRSR